MAKKTVKKDSFLDKIHTPNWLTAFLGVLFLFRIPSFFEPFSYGDEMIYLTLGEGVRRGLTLYQQVHDNKPPLLYYLAAIAGNVFWFRVILAFWMLVTTILFWKLTKHLFPKDTRVQKASTIIFGILTTIPLLEGQIANAELFMIGPTIAAFLLLLRKKIDLKIIFSAGLLFSVGTLFKMPSLFDMGVIAFLWLFSLNKLGLKEFFKRSVVLISGFLLPIGITVVWYGAKGALNDYVVSAFLENLGYLSSWRPDDVKEPFLTRNGPLLLRGLVVIAGAGILFVFRKKLSRPFIFATLWLLVSLFAATLSERPYPHYIIQVVPSVSLLLGILIAQSSIEQSLSLIPLLLFGSALVYFRFWYYPTLPYYERFALFATGRVTKEQYFSKFDGNVNRNYKISEFIVNSTRNNDPVFVWGDSPPIYALSRRLPPLKYVATYHINDFSNKEEVVKELTQKMPAFIVLLPDSPPFSEIIPLLNENYIIIASIDNALIWRKSSPEIIKAIR